MRVSPENGGKMCNVFWTHVATTVLEDSVNSKIYNKEELEQILKHKNT